MAFRILPNARLEASLNEDERRVVLLALKMLFHDIERSRLMGYPVKQADVASIVMKLGGNPKLL